MQLYCICFLLIIVWQFILSHSDVDECSTDNGGCSSNAECTNTNGSFSCSCRTGYHGDGFTCIGKIIVNIPLNSRVHKAALVLSMTLKFYNYAKHFAELVTVN